MTATRRKPGRMGPYIEGYTAWLVGLGYTRGTVVNMLAIAGDLGRWMDVRDLAPGDLDRVVAAGFRSACGAAGTRCVPGPRGLDPLLDYLEHVGVPRYSEQAWIPRSSRSGSATATSARRTSISTPT